MQRHDEDSDLPSQRVAFSWAGFIIAICALIAAGGAFGVAASNASPSESSGTASSSGPAQIVKVTLADISMTPKMTTVKAGSPVKFEVTNTGQTTHDFWLTTGEHTDMLPAGKSATLTVDSVKDGEQAYCNVPGHRAAGMQMMIHVEGASGAAAAAPAASADTAAPTLDFSAKAPDGFVARDPNAPIADGQTNHAITLDAVEKDIAVAPGVTQHAWTFNGTVPGPILRGKVGDVFTVTLRNKGTMSHSIDFHASQVAWSDEMRSIKPGEQLVYRFQATKSGIFMYHCGTAPALHHIGNGMFGAVIIDPPSLPKVDKEFVFIQSELYLGAQGKEADLQKMLDDKWDAVVFNGYVNQYRDRPIQVQPHERIRVWVLDAGPSENSSFHVVGTIFDTVYKEGTYLLRPGPEQGGAQALDLQPAQGGFVEFSLAETGYYPLVTHKFSNASKGAMGLFRAGDAQMPAGAGH
jgi:nitrite reductase (NO-forming)